MATKSNKDDLSKMSVEELIKTISGLNGDIEVITKQRDALALDNQNLKAESAKLKQEQAQMKADEALITSKMSRGLTRDQAVATIKRQREYDAKKEAAKAAAAPATPATKEPPKP